MIEREQFKDKIHEMEHKEKLVEQDEIDFEGWLQETQEREEEINMMYN